MSGNNVCYNCTERQIGCHSTCNKYITFKNLREAKKERIRKFKEDEGLVLGYYKDMKIKKERKKKFS